MLYIFPQNRMTLSFKMCFPCFPFQGRAELDEVWTVSSSESSTTSDDSQFELDGLDVHNALRKRHNLPALVLDQDLCDYAQDWANKLAATNRFEHRPDNDYGENLYTQWSSNPKADVKNNV